MFVTTGAPLDCFTEPCFTETTEIIDLNNPDAICQKAADIPVTIEGANGGFLLNKESATYQAVICGGLAKYGPADFRAEPMCYSFDNKNWVNTYVKLLLLFSKVYDMCLPLLAIYIKNCSIVLSNRIKFYLIIPVQQFLIAEVEETSY